jgi:BRCT domain type II-containing protein
MKELQNPLANELLSERIVMIDGIEINLWHGNTHDTIRNQMSWNKIISYTELNSHSEGINGNLVFSGVMQVKRDEAANYAIKMGFKVHQQITPSADFLIIGSENVSPSKIAMVMQLNSQRNKQIKIIEELTFLALVSEHIIK